MKSLLSGLLIVAIVGLFSCGHTSGTSGKSSSPKRGVDASGFPTGRFVHEFPSVWAFEFDEDGTWRGFEGDVAVPVISGKYATNGNLYTEMTHDYPGSPLVPATYFWKYDGNKLTFQLWGKDVNSHRKSVYDGQTYVKVE